MARAKRKPASPFVGLWHIASMTGWDENYFNEEVQAYLEFEENGTGTSSSATSPATWTGDRAHGTGSLPWSGPGKEATALTARR
jgi:hypothetical protein